MTMTKKVECLKESLCMAQFCVEKGLSDEEVVRLANEVSPSGTENGWQLLSKERRAAMKKDRPDLNFDDVDCADDPNRKHILMEC